MIYQDLIALRSGGYLPVVNVTLYIGPMWGVSRSAHRDSTQLSTVPSLVAFSRFICLNALSTCSFVISQNSQAGGGYFMLVGTLELVGFSGKNAVWNTSLFSELSWTCCVAPPPSLIMRSGTHDLPPSVMGCEIKLHISHMLFHLHFPAIPSNILF